MYNKFVKLSVITEPRIFDFAVMLYDDGLFVRGANLVVKADWRDGRLQVAMLIAAFLVFLSFF